MNRHERFKKAFHFLQGEGLAKSQKVVAERMGASEANISTALRKGDARVLTDSFLIRFASAFDGTFQVQWLLSGQGEMLQPKSEIIHYDGMLEPMAQMIRLLDDLRVQMKAELDCARTLTAELRLLIVGQKQGRHYKIDDEETAALVAAENQK